MDVNGRDPNTFNPNTIKVVLRRDSNANQPLPLFFGPILGSKTANLNATASATIYTGTINSLTQTTVNSGMLPLTYDVNHWNNFLKTGISPDGTTMTDASNPDHNKKNRRVEVKVFPLEKE